MTRGAVVSLWTSGATPVGELLDELSGPGATRAPQALSSLATRVARSILVDPRQSIGDASALIEPLLGGVDATARLAVLDLVNALLCAGAMIPPELEARAGRNLGELAELGPPLALRVRVALAAIIHGELDVAGRIAGDLPTVFFGDEEYPNDVLALVALATARAHSGPGALDTAWRRAVFDFDELHATGQINEPTVLWLARMVYQRSNNEPVGRVAALAHDEIWAERAAPIASELPAVPLTDLLGGGTCRVERHLQGRGEQKLWRGCELATGADLLVASDGHNRNRQDPRALAQLLSYGVPGIFELVYVGAFDPGPRRMDDAPQFYWATVERVTAGTWLPHILGPADPWTAPAKAVSLGRSAGRILLRAMAAGINLTRMRPELMWAERRDGELVVTGLSPRATELFARKVGEMVTHPVFDRFYYAPELYEDPDDRAVSYSLAVMVAEWATGRYPFKFWHAPLGVETAQHLPIGGPRPLARLLEATIRRDREDRPRLAEFVAELERMVL